MKQVYTERRRTEQGHGSYPDKELKVTAFETDKNDPELLPSLIHLWFLDLKLNTRPVEEWHVLHELRGAQVIRQAILIFDKAAARRFPSEEGAE